jgi:preprotein translocase subunit SecG
MFTLIVLLIIILCIAMTLVVLAQSSKGDGLSGALGGPGSVGAVFGVRRASDFLQKTTIWMGGAFVVLCIFVNLFFLPTGSNIPSAVTGGKAPSAQQSQPSQQQPSAGPAASRPAAPSGPAAAPAGAQPGTGQTNPDNSPMPKQR